MKNHSFKLILFLCFLPLLSIGQSKTIEEMDAILHEAPDQAYIEVSRASMEKSPAYRQSNSTFFTAQVNVDNNGDNMIGDAANEPSIAVDPTNPDRMVIGWRQFDTVDSNFRQAGNGHSTDGGATWTFPGVINPGIFRSDPVLDFDADGNFFYNSLTTGFTCDVYTIDDGGTDWGAPVSAHGGDKQWMRIDRTDGIGAGNNYSNWNVSFTTCAPGDFTRSTDGADSFEDCEPVIASPRWGTLAVDAEGTLYISGTTNGFGLIIAKSTTAKDPAIPVSWDSFSPVDLDGFLNVGQPVNPQGLLGQMWVDVDISGGDGHGNVYVLASVGRISNSDPGDVMFAKSTDGGINYSVPTQLNLDEGTTATQWLGTMSVAPNGRIDVVWLDTRDAPAGTNMSKLYYRFSEDQGDSWSTEEILSEAFDPNIGYPQQNKMGDYFDMVSDNNGAHLAWVNTLNGGQDVYYTHITPSILDISDYSLEDSINFSVYPNPFSEALHISFTVASEKKITIEIFDILGRKITTLFNKKGSGEQAVQWNGNEASGAKASSGLYFVKIQVDNKSFAKEVVLK